MCFEFFSFLCFSHVIEEMSGGGFVSHSFMNCVRVIRPGCSRVL